MVTGPVPENVLPRAGVGVGQVVRPEAHHGAVLFVQGMDLQGAGAGSDAQGVGDGEGTGEEGSRVPAQGVQEEVVEGEEENVGGCL
jgi:hypothetical protein